MDGRAWGGLAIVACVAAQACGAPEERPACAPAALAAIEAAYVAEVLKACDGAPTADDCAAYPEIRDRYAKAREEWKVCR